MGEWVHTEICIGGTASANVADELATLLAVEFSEVDQPEASRHWLHAHGQRNYGNADEVEEFCQEHGLAYVLSWSAASGAFDAGSHAWRPGMEDAAELAATDDGDPSAPLAELKRDYAAGKTLADVIAALQVGDASTLPPYIVEQGEETTDASDVEEPAPVARPCVADVLARAEAFVSGFEDDELQESVAALLRDLRAAQER